MSALADWAPMLLVAGLCLLALPGRNPLHPMLRAFAAAGTALLFLRYLAWRISDTLPPMEEGWSYAIGCVFLALELAVAVGALIQLHVLSRSYNRSHEVDARLTEQPEEGTPLIDVFIPSYNEAPEILRRTIVGAVAQEYPRFRVWVLDDGRRDWLRQMAAELGSGYLTRSDNAHAKAGNMNAGLAKVLALPEPPDAIAILDADFVATPNFLQRTAALLKDQQIGLVQTPQYFFNPDPVQLNLGAPRAVADEQRFLFDVLLPSKDAHGTAFSCGTSGLVRVAALLKVGGFPTESVTEDFLLSLKLKEAGFSTAYLQEPLTAGLAPEGLKEYLTQRGRWCLGTMQIMRTPWGPLSAGRVPWLMRIHTLESVLYWSVGSWLRIACLLAPVLYYWFGLTVMNVELQDVLWYAAPSWLATAAFLGWVSRGTLLPVVTDAVGLLSVWETTKRSLVGLFGPIKQRFRVTAKGASRDRVVVQWSLMRPFLLGIAATLGGMAFQMLESPGAGGGSEAVMIFWSVYNLLVLLLACLLCIEQPRFRSEERFSTDEAVVVGGTDAPMLARLQDISVGGCRLEMPTHAAPFLDRLQELEIGGIGRVPVRVVRQQGSECGIAFEVGPETERALIRKLFSGAYLKPVRRVRVRRLGGVVLRSVFASSLNSPNR